MNTTAQPTIIKINDVFGPRTFSNDNTARGSWVMEIHEMGIRERMTESEVIEILKEEKNWKELRSQYFPMYGFHQ